MTRVLLIGGPYDGEWQDIEGDLDAFVTSKDGRVARYLKTTLTATGLKSGGTGGVQIIYRLESLEHSQALRLVLAGYKKGSGE